MAHILKHKTASEVVERSWFVPVESDDNPASVVLVASGVTVDANEFEGDELVLTLSAGTAAQTGTITATVTTDKSRTIIETLYIPIIESSSQIADTARNYIEFALRPIVGFGRTPKGQELTDGLERLEAMLAEWRQSGAEIGSVSPLASDSVIYCPDYAANAIRYNLRIRTFGDYGHSGQPQDYDQARRGLQLIEQENLPDERDAVYY